MMEAPQEKLHFDRPPVDEVVLSVLFEPLYRLLAPHLGDIWKEYKRDGFVDIGEHPPVIPAVEKFPNPTKRPELRINVTDLPRLWFIHEDDSQIIQVQRDRFTFNWRRTTPEQQYPGFSVILNCFQVFYNRFCQIISRLEAGTVTPSQFELTYIDQLFQGTDWDTLDSIGKIYNIFVDSQPSNSFWSGAESMILRTSFPVADLNGRLHLTISNRIKKVGGQQTLQTEFTLRGFQENTEQRTIITWFKSAHGEIRKKFVSMFTEDIQTQAWKRKS